MREIQAKDTGVLHCWEEGPRSLPDMFGNTVGSTCLLPDAHDGPHEFTSDTEFMIRFAGKDKSAQREGGS